MSVVGRGCVKTCTDEKMIESFSSLGHTETPYPLNAAFIKQCKTARLNIAKNSRPGLSLRTPTEGNRILTALFALTFSILYVSKLNV